MSNIKQYNPVIYPRKLWVAIQPTYEQIRDMFSIKDVDLKNSDFEELKSHSLAATYPLVKSKKGLNFGSLVVVFDKNLTINAISHEAYHIMNAIMTDLGEEPCGDLEQNAYFLGWVAEKIQESLVDKK